MIDPLEVLGGINRNRIIMASERLRKVTEASCLSRAEFEQLSGALRQLNQAVDGSEEVGPSPIFISAGVVPLANRKEVVSTLQDVAKELHEINAEDWVPDPALRSLTRSLAAVEEVLGEIS